MKRGGTEARRGRAREGGFEAVAAFRRERLGEVGASQARGCRARPASGPPARRSPCLRAPVLALLSLAFLSGCFLFPKTPDPIAYLAPAASPLEAAPFEQAAPVLRLAPVGSADHLQELVVWHKDGIVGFYDARRWVEPPAALVEEAVRAALFDTGRFRPATAGPHPVLQLDVEAFDEVIAADDSEAALTVRATLFNDAATGLWTRTYRLTAPVQSDDPAAFGAAMSSLLADLRAQLATDIATALAR